MTERIGSNPASTTPFSSRGSGMIPPFDVPTPTTSTDTPRPPAAAIARCTLPLHTWPSEMTTNVRAFLLGPYIS